MILSVKLKRKSSMEIEPVAAMPQTSAKDYSIQLVSKVDENTDKIINKIYTVITYDQVGKLEYYTSLRYIDYLI